MGRQVPIFATQVDVNDLTAFLRETTEVAIFVAFAEPAERLWVETPAIDEDSFFYVWNKHFPWTPTYGRVRESASNPRYIGWYYFANGGNAPVVEFDCGTPGKRR